MRSMGSTQGFDPWVWPVVSAHGFDPRLKHMGSSGGFDVWVRPIGLTHGSSHGVGPLVGPIASTRGFDPCVLQVAVRIESKIKNKNYIFVGRVCRKKREQQTSLMIVAHVNYNSKRVTGGVDRVGLVLLSDTYAPSACFATRPWAVGEETKARVRVHMFTCAGS